MLHTYSGNRQDGKTNPCCSFRRRPCECSRKYCPSPRALPRCSSITLETPTDNQRLLESSAPARCRRCQIGSNNHVEGAMMISSPNRRDVTFGDGEFKTLLNIIHPKFNVP
ncbi:hypothetical protein KC19_VG281500 [Ceratodon purpureus]|uniref:Uncharacterized protein n=1 Tax=Ceratodon purpureus TaxID=3225 RepID=A0A8T0HUZ2_CERPU|nr:hypothetical protein KC19_VG281500 [Ceratodon purpureus]